MSHRPELPRVTCIMLVNGRGPMVARAVASFRSQTYKRKRLLVLDTTEYPVLEEQEYYSIADGGQMVLCRPQLASRSVGWLRNFANDCMGRRTDLFAHWDSDDWSHPKRLAEQVEFLVSSGKCAVGYNDMLFWDTTSEPASAWVYMSRHPNKFLGSSMMYKREAWELSRFHPDEPNEDTLWWMQNQNRCAAVSSNMALACLGTPVQPGKIALNSNRGPVKIEPRMICAIHGANTSEAYKPAMRVAPHWQSARHFEPYCQEHMV